MPAASRHGEGISLALAIRSDGGLVCELAGGGDSAGDCVDQRAGLLLERRGDGFKP